MHAENTIAKILLIRLDHMGDAILMTPVVQALSARFPDAEISCIVSSRSAPVFEFDPRIKTMKIIDLHASSYREKWNMAKWVRDQKFDVVISLTEKFWAAMWSLFSQSRVRVGFDAGITLPLHFMWRVPSYNHRIHSASNPLVASPWHEVNRYMQLLRPLGISERVELLDVRTDPAAQDWGRQYLKDLQLPANAILVGFHFSALWGGEGWTQDVQNRIIQELLTQDKRIVVIGTAGPGETSLLEQLSQTFPAERFYLCQALNFSQWVELVRQFQVYVSFETGSAHISAIAGVPTVMVFPQKEFLYRSTRWHPWGVKYRLVQRPLPSPTNEKPFISSIAKSVEEIRQCLSIDV